MTIGAMEGFIAMQYRLHVIIPRRHVAQAADGIAVGGIIHRDGLPRLHAVNVHTEHHLGADRIVNLHAGFGGRIGRKKQEDASVERLSAAGLGKRNRKSGAGGMGERSRG